MEPVRGRGRTIVFVRERAKESRTQCNAECETNVQVPQSELSGNEAKNFYEHVISMPQESCKGATTARRKRKRSKAKQITRTSKTLKTAQSSVSPTSVDEVFRKVQEGDLDRVVASVSSGVCDVNTTDQFHWTLLMSAAHAGHIHVVDYLLRVGAKWRDYVDKSGYNAVDLAKKAGHLSLACFIETYERCVVEGDEERETASQDGGSKRHTKSRHPKATTYYCDECKQTVTDNPTERHTTSTVHQFSCQHRPPVPGYAIPRSNRGYQMMLRGGWNPDRGLGSEQEGRKYPVKTVLKQDRLGFGQSVAGSSQGKARVTHFAAFDERAVKRRSERFDKSATAPRKKDILTAAHKDKQWEVRMRRYMNNDDYGSQYS